MDEKLNAKLQKIEELLSDESEFENYINNIDNTQISYSNKLEEKILLKTNEKKSLNYVNVIKMVACMMLALILSQTSYIKEGNLGSGKEVTEVITEKNTFLSDKVSQISDFFMKPLNNEKGEK